MFGEESMYAQKEVVLDSKGRIVLPSDTKREKGDQLILTYDADMSSYEICNVVIYDKTIEELRRKLLNAENKTDEIFYKKKIYEVSKSVIKKMHVDGQGRVNIGNIFDHVNSVLCIGACDRLILEPVEKNSDKKSMYY